MGNLKPDRRSDRNGRLVTRWVRKLTGNDSAPVIPSPVVDPPIAPQQLSPIEILSKSLPTRRDEIEKVFKFVVSDGVNDFGEQESLVERFLMKMEEKTLRELNEFIDDKENGYIVRSMCANMVGGMALKYRERNSDFGIDYTQLHNVMLLGEDFQRSTPGNFLDEIKETISFNAVRDLTFRFESLMDEIKPQNLSKTPDFATLPEKTQRNARVALVIANVYYTGADNGQRHRESELLECVDRHFDRRFEITSILDRHMDATPSMIDENMEIKVVSMQEGWL